MGVRGLLFLAASMSFVGILICIALWVPSHPLRSAAFLSIQIVCFLGSILWISAKWRLGSLWG